MRSSKQREVVLALVDDGMNDCAIARRTGVPRSTVRDMRRARDRPRKSGTRASACPLCDELPLRSDAYAYLLGTYLGDGHITSHARGVHRLTIFCDLLYVDLAREVVRAMEAVRVSRCALRPVPAEGVLLAQSYWKHWPCLLPQHGPGRKHERPIVLEPWQAKIVDAHPERFVRGLIHSDGCRSLNTIRHPKRTYVYPRYEFCNRSDDIRELFSATCDRLGVPWTQMNRWTISVARREAVATLDRFVGPKS